MAAVKVGIVSPVADGLSLAPPYLVSPTADRKRRLRSPSSDRGISREGRSSTSGSISTSPGANDRRRSPLDMTQDRYPSAHSSVSASFSGSASASGTATAGSGSSRGLGGEDTLTLRRREANRLAAQRFRSRKKGYQDSLEERIRILEEEKDVLARGTDHSHHQRFPHEDAYFRRQHHRSLSPDKQIDAEVRVASLESANRRLQDELRGVVDENERLREELNKWRRWERDYRDVRREEERHPRTTPILPPLETQPMAPPSYPTTPYPPSYPCHPPLQRGHSYTNDDSRRLPSPGLRLPPLRLPHIEPSHSPHGRPLLPRPESMERFSHGTGSLLPQLSPTNARE